MKQNTKKSIRVFFFSSYVYKIGGIETWIYYMIQGLSPYYEITFLFENAYPDQLKRIKDYADIQEIDYNINYECDVLIMASNWCEVPKNITYKKCIQTIHSDYKYSKEVLNYTFKIPKEADLFVSVSETVKKSLEDIYGVKSTIVPNILGSRLKTNKVLHLVSFTRLTQEKGYDRMCVLANFLKEKKIKFDWKIFSDINTLIGLNKMDMPEIIYMPPTLDVYDYISDADYLVQLSDVEAFCYSVHEALQYGTPVIVTDIPAFASVVDDGCNGYILDKDMKNLENKINDIVNKIPKDFEYIKANIVEDWISIIGESSTIDRNIPLNMEKYLLKCIIPFYDCDDEIYRNQGDEFLVNKLRAYELTSLNNKGNIKLCEIIKK